MFNIKEIEKSLRGCGCGREHKIGLGPVEISPGAAALAGEILRAAGMDKKLLVVCDENTLAASGELPAHLERAGFAPALLRFGDLRSADIEGVERVISGLSREGAGGILSVGTGSLNDICRYAAFKTGIPFGIFATAPSMDGFASNMAPITQGGFKRTYPAVGPACIIADTEIMSKSPRELKAAGLGDLLGKYTAHADWRAAVLVSGEYWCGKIAALTRESVDRAVALANRGDTDSPSYCGALMEALIISGAAMLCSGSTRPASGAEHHISHFWEMMYAMEGRPQVFHGKKVGIACAMVADIYRALAKEKTVRVRRADPDYEKLREVFGPLWPLAKDENIPNPLDKVPDGSIEENWDAIRQALAEVPSGEEIRALLRAAGGEDTCAAAGIPEELEYLGIRYGRYSRFRITAMRLLEMLDWEPDYPSSYAKGQDRYNCTEKDI